MPRLRLRQGFKCFKSLLFTVINAVVIYPMLEDLGNIAIVKNAIPGRQMCGLNSNLLLVRIAHNG